MGGPFLKKLITRRRKIIRLKEYDYSSSGAYFVTICTHNKENVFGKIVDGEVHLSDVGEIAHKCWIEIPNHFYYVNSDVHVIMPNHVHSIIIINKKEDIPGDNFTRKDIQLNVPTEKIKINVSAISAKISPRQGTLSVIVRTYKAAVTTECRRYGYSNFLWQSRFYEHIIRDERDYRNIQEYIPNNPLQWSFDKENPLR